MSVRKISRFMAASRDTDVSHVILWHLSISQRRAQVAKHDHWENPEDMASTIFEEARTTAAAFPGPQRFIVTAHTKEDVDNTSPITTMGFTVESNEDGFSGQTGSEPPTSEGLLAQLMRHNETKDKQLAAMFGTVTSYLVRDNEKKAEQIEHLLGLRSQMIETMEDLQSQKHARDLETKALEASDERKKDLFGKIMTYLPVAVNHLAGKELVRQKDSEMELVASEWVQSLSTTQLDAMRDAGLLKPEQLVLLGTLVQKVATRFMDKDQKQEQSEEAHDIANKLPSERA
jgi:hypothetical protein